MMVDKSISEEWSERHNLCRGRRMMMPEPAHHQGSRSLPEYQEVWVCEFTSLFFVTLNFACLLIILLFSSQSASHEGQPCNEFMAYAMAHKGKATSDVSFSQTDPPEAYSNPSVHTRIHDYTAMGKVLHGDTWDPATVPLYGEAIMRVGGGKKHCRYWLADSVVDTASTPNLSQLRARTTDSTPPIRPRPETSVATMQALQVISISFIFC